MADNPRRRSPRAGRGPACTPPPGLRSGPLVQRAGSCLAPCGSVLISIRTNHQNGPRMTNENARPDQSVLQEFGNLVCMKSAQSGAWVGTLSIKDGRPGA